MTEPSTAINTAPTVVIVPHYTDPQTGAQYIHKDLVGVRGDWATEDHIAPPKVDDAFGDVESFVGYVKRYAQLDPWQPLLTWSSAGLKAVIDPHGGIEEPGRAQWIARQPFVLSPEWRQWTALANGQVAQQRVAIEKLEELGEDIADPPQAQLMDILRTLRANVSAQAHSTLNPDGTTSTSWSQDKSIKGAAGGEVELPGIITIVIPVLVGDPLKTEIRVRLRAFVGDDAKLGLRFQIMNAERTLDAVYLERVQAAKDLLGENFVLLRSAG